VSDPILSAPLLGGRVLELARDGWGWRLAVTQIDGRDRRQVGGFDLTPDEIPLFLASLTAIAAYAKGARPEQEHLRGGRAA
jgi:hypothetical protein